MFTNRPRTVYGGTNEESKTTRSSSTLAAGQPGQKNASTTATLRNHPTDGIKSQLTARNALGDKSNVDVRISSLSCFVNTDHRYTSA